MLFVLSFAISNAQNKLMQIKVLNKITKEAIDGAVISFNGSYSVTSDEGTTQIPT